MSKVASLRLEQAQLPLPTPSVSASTDMHSTVGEKTWLNSHMTSRSPHIC